MSKKIGIFGGTFDPIHWGHLFMAEFFSVECELDQVLFVPAYISPLKIDRKIGHLILTSVEDRMKMITAAIKDNPKFVFEDFEIRREKVSYTIETLNYLKDKYSDTELYLLVGEDNAGVFHHWSQPDAILEKSRVIVFRRGDRQEEVDPGNLKYWDQMTFLQSPLVDISSSEIRARCSRRKSLRYWVPKAVEIYIQENNLYR